MGVAAKKEQTRLAHPHLGAPSRIGRSILMGIMQFTECSILGAGRSLTRNPVK
jgi:hypothetical protein